MNAGLPHLRILMLFLVPRPAFFRPVSCCLSVCGRYQSYVSLSLLGLVLPGVFSANIFANSESENPPAKKAPLVVTHISAAIYGNSRREYEAQLLRLALEKTRAQLGDYNLQAAPRINTSKRDIRIMRENELDNFIRAFTVREELIQDPDLIHIDFPIFRGAMGVRICLTSNKNKARVEQVTNIEDLQKLSFVHGVGWSDTEILREAGLNVIEGGQYVGVFEMTARSRADLFCRGIGEYLEEFTYFQPRIPELAIEERFAIVYPYPRYFFTNKKNRSLVERITAGLAQAKQDGSFMAHWANFHREGIKRANLGNRKFFYLENPLLDSIKINYGDYFHPEADKLFSENHKDPADES